MPATSKAIYQDLLDKMSHALFERDLETWLDGLILPHRMTTCDGSIMLETPEDVAVSFNDYVAALENLAVVRMERTCEIARPSEPGRIEGYHTTAMFQANGDAFPAYTVKWVLCQCADGQWRVSKGDSALSAETWADIPYHQLSLFRRSDSDADMELRRWVQAYLDKLDTTLLHGNFEEWQSAFKLPFVVETANGQTIIDTPERLRTSFDVYANAFRVHRVTDFTRVVRSAEQIDENFMMATYRAHLLSGPQYVIDPWNGALTLRREDGRWYLTKLIGSRGPLHWRPRTVTTQPGPAAHAASAKRALQEHPAEQGDGK